MQCRKCRNCELWWKEAEKKNINRPDSGTAGNSLSSRRSLTHHESYRPLQIFERQDLQLKEQASRTPDSSCDLNQTHVITLLKIM
ncbi:hypothetical protein TNCV_1740341 [Trichonephila clavipes]|uniref:Uncharacterized protein n=1 Tax=Trichonephila clavipes TaxID=2585209 RepID=A0A8X6V3S5_TRICX|nr:hypothetical protein TNCV_1740341 [Trichonephila clavipes]